MANERQRVEGMTETLTGKIKKGLGRIFHNRGMEARGAAEQVEGKARTAAADAKSRVEQVAGNAKDSVDDVIHNPPPR